MFQAVTLQLGNLTEHNKFDKMTRNTIKTGVAMRVLMKIRN